MRQFYLIILMSFFSSTVLGQILHYENFAVILDTTKHVKGNIVPSFQFQNLKEDLIKFENTADFTVLFDHNAFTIANKVELSRFGDETYQSGGYLFIEYRRIQDTLPFALEPYFQAHWNEVRGLDRKYAAGFNLRWRVLYKKNLGIFAGIGPFTNMKLGITEVLPKRKLFQILRVPSPMSWSDWVVT